MAMKFFLELKFCLAMEFLCVFGVVILRLKFTKFFKIVYNKKTKKSSKSNVKFEKNTKITLTKRAYFVTIQLKGGRKRIKSLVNLFPDAE